MSDTPRSAGASSFEPVSASLNQICNRFEEACKAGAKPLIEDQLREYNGPDRARLLRELLAVELEYSSGANVEEYRRRFPDYLVEVEAAFRKPAPSAGPAKQTSPPAAGNSPDSPSAEFLAAGPVGQDSNSPAASTTATGGRCLDGGWELSTAPRPGQPAVAGYEILGELGAGGMGIVYKARQVRLKRIVALKMILAGPHAGPAHLARFRTEVEAVARLQHPHIVQIHEIGNLADQPYCALEYVEGGTLAQRLAAGPLPVAEAARQAELLARAMHHAHHHQVVHRDLKPANVLMTLDGQPKVTDFGLAKQLDEDSGQTKTGQVMGTPSYMAPEQAQGCLQEIGPATDVYALGAILYEMLAGRPPFKGAISQETLEHVRTRDPVPPSRHRPGVPRDLETICLKCLAKEPSCRYHSALALAQDLERFRAGESILARPEGLPRKLGRRLRRHRFVAAVGAALFVTLVVAGFLAVDYRHARQVAALQQTLETGLDLEAVQWMPAHLDDVEAKIAELSRLDAAKAADYRKRLQDRFRRVLLQDIDQPRLEQPAIDRLEGLLRALEARAPAEAPEFRRRFQQRLAGWQTVFEQTPPFAAWDHVFLAADVEPGDSILARRSRSLSAPKGVADPVVLTTVGCSGNTQIETRFDSESLDVPEVGLLLNANRGHSQPLKGLAWAADGRMLATNAGDESVCLWETQSGLETRTLLAGAAVNGLAFAPGGGQLALATAKGIMSFDLAKGQWQPPPGPTIAINSVAFSADGRWLAAAQADDKVAVVDVTTWQARATLPANSRGSRYVAFSPDSRTLASAGQDQTVRFWEVPTFQEKTWLARSSGPVLSLVFAPDGKLATSSPSRVTLWDVAAGKEFTHLDLPDGVGQKIPLTFSPDGATLAVGTVLWDLRRQKVDDWLTLLVPQSDQAAYSPDGARLAVALQNGAVKMVDPVRRVLKSTMAGKSYAFVLSALPATGQLARSGEQSPKLDEWRRQGKPLHLQIRRDGVTQREQAVTIPSGALTLRASRVGDQLQLQVNDLPPMVFRDAFPLPILTGTYGIVWPTGARIAYLHAQRQALPPVPSPLERGDDLLARRLYAEALAVFEQLVLSVGQPTANQEARFKAGLCLLELNRDTDAAARWEGVAGESGDRWPLVASCQLWALRLRQKRWSDAEAVFTNLSNRYTFEELAAVVPEEDRQPLLREYALSGADWIMFTTGMEGRYERVLKVLEYLRAPLASRMGASKNLMRAYQLVGRNTDALHVVEEILREWAQVRAMGVRDVVVEYAFLLRLTGRPERAKDELGRWAALIDHPADVLLEQARTAAALGDLDQADLFLDHCEEVLRKKGKQTETLGFSGVYLLRGFLLEKRGDLDKAQEVWRQGFALGRRQQETDEGLEYWREPGSFFPLLYQLILGGLSNQMTEAEARKFMERFFAGVRSDSLPTQFGEILQSQATAVRQMWQTPRGRDYARRLAFRSLPFGEMVRTPAALFMVEMIRQGSFGGKLTADQDEAAWQATWGGIDLFYSAKISRVQVLQLALTWKGTSNAFTWGAAGPLLPPAIRGPIAYVMGHRFLRLEKEAEAKTFFESALGDAAPDSSLQRLAQAELDRLKKN